MTSSSKMVIFLDIDGVLQPLSSQHRFEHDLDELRTQLAIKYKNDDYLLMDRYDLGAVYYDWDLDAVERLRKLCIDFNAEIIITSSWIDYSALSRLKEYFKLHGLDIYIGGNISVVGRSSRVAKIAEYLEQHQDVDRFVILDDAFVDDFRNSFAKHFVYCRFIFDEDCYQQARSILLG